jgi:hypothetical protein
MVDLEISAAEHAFCCWLGRSLPKLAYVRRVLQLQVALTNCQSPKQRLAKKEGKKSSETFLPFPFERQIYMGRICFLLTA